METPPNTTDLSQEKEKKRSPWLIVVIILLLFLIGCCIIGVVFCRGSSLLPDLLDRYTDYEFDPDSDFNFDDFWGLVDGNEDFPDLDYQDGEATPTHGITTSSTGCPSEPTEFILEVDHTWDYAPNRDLASMKIDGWTEPPWQCPLTIEGRKVMMEPCQFPISTEGFVQTDAGPCTITATGYAIVTLDEPFCENGMLITRIIESSDADAEASGEMVCPGVTQPYFPFFPHSNTPETFIIKPGGDTQNEFADPEIMNQFKYDKNWTLYP